MTTCGKCDRVGFEIKVCVFFAWSAVSVLGYGVRETVTRQYFVPEGKYASKLAVQMLANGAQFR